MEVSGKELESHKAKRLVARNEMIGAAQVTGYLCVNFNNIRYNIPPLATHSSLNPHSYTTPYTLPRTLSPSHPYSHPPSHTVPPTPRRLWSGPSPRARH